MFSVVGRNGMGKTTLCKAIMGLVRASAAARSACAARTSLGCRPARIARLGVGYVPQGRRLWRSLSVDEHLRLAAGMRRGAWTVERIYDTFPRLAERKDHGGGQLSGGEQQMLAISRALLTNPQLLIMDEPTEGLAPVIVAQVEEMLVRLGEDGDMSVLVIEQNIGVATAISKNVAIMVNGRINRIIDSARLAADRELQQRLLGVGVMPTPSRDRCRRPPSERRDAAPAAAARRERGADPDLHLQPDAADALVAAGADRAHRGRRAHAVDRRRAARRDRTAQARAGAGADAPGRRSCWSSARSTPRATELRFIRDIIAGSGLRTRLVDVSTSGKLATCDVSAQEIALNHGRGGSAVFGPDRGASVTAMADAFANWLRAPGQRRRHHFGAAARAAPRWSRRRMRALPDRRAEADDLLGRLRRRRPLCRPGRHHHDVFGHRRAGPQLDLARGARQRRQRASPAW